MSVVIPTLDQPAYLLETLASVFAQTWTDREIIVVDDGSGPGTRSALEPCFDRIRYLWQPNAGQSAARNRGAREATGEFLAFLDHDDLWEPTYLETALGYLDAHPGVGLVSVAMRTILADGTRTPRIARKRSPGDRFSTRTLLEGDVGTLVNPVVRRDAFLAAGGYDTEIHGPEDCDLWIRLSFSVEMRHVHEPLLLYRVHPGNTSRELRGNAENWIKILDKLERQHPDFVAENRALVLRERAKHLIRLGREQLRRADAAPGGARSARRTFREAVRLDPGRWKARLYWLLSWVPGIGGLYAAWRRVELPLHERFKRTRLATRVRDWRYAPRGGPRR